MIANRVLSLLIGVLALPLIPLAAVSTFVLGIVVKLTFGLLLLPLSLLWMIFLGPMLLLSRFSGINPFVRNVIGFVGLPWVLVADTFVSLVPSMGERENRSAKMLLCYAWPYTWEAWLLWVGRLDFETEAADQMIDALVRSTHWNSLERQVLVRMLARKPLDANL